MVTSFTYDEMGRKVTQTDAKGQTTTFGYDERGRITARQLPDGKTDAMEFDALGQLRAKRDFRGMVTRYDYDVRGRMLSKVPDSRLGEESVTYTYTGENFRAAKRGTLVTAYTSDADRGWLSLVSGPNGTVKYSYNAYGDRTEVEAAGGTTTYSYDTLGRMDTVSDQATGASAAKQLAKYRYDAVGNLDTTVTSNGASAPVATTRYGYDTLNRLSAMSHRRGLQDDGALLSGYDYRVRADGKRIGFDETVADDQTAATPRVSQRSVGFSYDDAGRLISENGRDGEGTAYQLNWALDKVGNRASETRLKAKDAASTNWTGGSLTRIVSGYSTGGTDWLTATTTTRGTTNAAGDAFTGTTTQTQTGYGYDSNGSQTRKTTQSADSSNSEGMEWSFEGALLRVEKGENNATKFTYDAGGNRIQTLTRDGAKTTAANYLVDENTAYAQVLEERDSSGELQARYVYGQGYGPLWMHRVQKNGAGTVETRDRYLLADGHGSVRQLVTDAGVVTDSYFYDAWGGGLSGGSGNTVNPYRYNGQQTDEATGGYYLRARYYQPGNGRFLGHDPEMGFNIDPPSLHRYLYANADGVNGVDPSGRMTLTETNAVMGNLGRLSRIGIDFLKFVDKAQNALDAIQTAQQIFDLIFQGNALNQIQIAIEAAQGTLRGSNADQTRKLMRRALVDAIENLEENLPTLLSRSFVPWSKWLAIHGSKVTGFLLYLPNPGFLPKFDIPTGLKLGKKQVFLVSQGVKHWGTVLGVGFRAPGMKGTDQDQQVWRMDYHPWHMGRGSGSSSANANEVSVWQDGDFHYHVMYPKYAFI